LKISGDAIDFHSLMKNMKIKGAGGKSNSYIPLLKANY